jgi:hypothetical protein
MDSRPLKDPQPLLDPSAPEESVDIVVEPEPDPDSSYILQAFVLENTRPHHLKAIGVFLMITATALPISTAFSGIWLGFIIISAVMGLCQILLGIVCFISGWRPKSARFLKNLAWISSIFLLLQLAYILLLESYGMYTVVDHNYSNCEDFTLNKVCDKRWGLMTGNILLIIFLPALDILYLLIVAIIHRMISHVSKRVQDESESDSLSSSLN